MKFNTAHMAAMTDSNFLPVTELADTLVRSTDISFHAAHQIVNAAVKKQISNDTGYDPEAMTSIIKRTLSQAGRIPQALTDQQIRDSLSARNFVAIRVVPGGPAPIVLEPEITRAQQQLVEDQ